MPIPAGPAPDGLVSLDDLKAVLNITTASEDVELQQRLDAALAEYAEWVRPVEGGTVRVSGGAVVVLPVGVETITSLAYTDGTTVDVSTVDFDAPSGVLRLPSPARGTRNLLVTYTVTAIPDNHRDAILSDVAELWTRTQRGGGSRRPQFPDQASAGVFEPVGRPLVLFPRIRALAVPSVA